MRQLRVLTISKPYVAAAYRDKFVHLAARGDLAIGLITPPAWGSQTFETSLDEAREAKIWTRLLPIAFNGKNHFHFYKGLEAAVRAFSPDVLNVEEEHYSVVTWQALRLARRLQVKGIFYTWQNIEKTYPPPFSWLERDVFKMAAAGVVGNAEAGEILRRKGFLKPIREIPQMGVDLSRFSPGESGDTARRQRKDQLIASAASKQPQGLFKEAPLARMHPESFWVAYFGRLVREKGVADLIAAVAQLRTCEPAGQGAHRMQILVVGDGPDAQTLRDEALRRNLEDRVVFIPQIPSQDVAKLLQAVDVLCLPSHTQSNWKEQFGRILVEAMAAGAVPVGSSSGEIPRVIGDAGLVFNESDAGALAKILDSLSTNRDQLLKLRAAGAKRVAERYTNEIIASQFAELFLAVSGRGK